MINAVMIEGISPINPKNRMLYSFLLFYKMKGKITYEAVSE